MPTNPPTPPESGRRQMPPGSMPISPPPPRKRSPPPADSWVVKECIGARDREMLERLDRMMGHILRRNPNDHTADIVAREIAEHLELYPLRRPIT